MQAPYGSTFLTTHFGEELEATEKTRIIERFNDQFKDTSRPPRSKRTKSTESVAKAKMGNEKLE